MKFLIDGVEVSVVRIPFFDTDGHILQLRISCGGNGSSDLFQRILSVLDKDEGGVMSNSETDSDDCVEIRLLGGLEFPTIFTIMGLGLNVTQMG